jgi:hypothetical protein
VHHGRESFRPEDRILGLYKLFRYLLGAEGYGNTCYDLDQRTPVRRWDQSKTLEFMTIPMQFWAIGKLVARCH